MKEILLILDFLCPLFFFFLGRAKKGKTGRLIVRESIAVLFAVAIFAPLAARYYSLTVQCGLTATVLFCQSLLLAFALRKERSFRP